jgi:hypothetical protein
VDQLPEEGKLQGVPAGLQRLSVAEDELKGQRRERRDGRLTHGMVPFEIVVWRILFRMDKKGKILPLATG